MTNQNPVVTGVAGIAGGALGGGALGALGAKGTQLYKGKLLKQYGDIDQLDDLVRKQYSKDVRKYYQDYIQESTMNKDGIINFTNKGQREVLRWNPKQGQNFPNLKKDIYNSKKMPNMVNMDDDKVNTSYFEVYKGKNGVHLIDVDKIGNRKYYITKDTPSLSLRATSTGGTGSANNIITDNVQKFNPSNGQKSKLWDVIHNQKEKAFNSLYDLIHRNKR